MGHAPLIENPAAVVKIVAERSTAVLSTVERHLTGGDVGLLTPGGLDASTAALNATTRVA